jgi:hypothetical protein
MEWGSSKEVGLADHLFFSCYLLSEFCPGQLVNVRPNTRPSGGEEVGCLEQEGREREREESLPLGMFLALSFGWIYPLPSLASCFAVSVKYLILCKNPNKIIFYGLPRKTP